MSNGVDDAIRHMKIALACLERAAVSSSSSSAVGDVAQVSTHLADSAIPPLVPVCDTASVATVSRGGGSGGGGKGSDAAAKTWTDNLSRISSSSSIARGGTR